MASIAVLGAGIIGLSSAVAIQEMIPKSRVTIYAERFSPNTTSDGAAGIWTPYKTGNTDFSVIRDLAKTTHSHLSKLAKSELAGEIGVQFLSGYYIYRDDSDPLPVYFRDILYNYKQLTNEELKEFTNAKSGYFATTVQVDVTPYLKWLTRRFTEKGGIIQEKKIVSLSEMANKCDIVVNCCGLGARQLLSDMEIGPVKGQVVRVKAPWIKHFYFFFPTKDTEISYILPGINDVVIGGTSNENDWDLSTDDNVSKQLWERAISNLPSLKKAKLSKVWTGLRPVRTNLRLQRETLVSASSKQLKVVHNYGHGGSGITLHWGCAVTTANMVKRMVESQNVLSKL